MVPRVPVLLIIAVFVFVGLLWWMISQANREASRIDHVWQRAADELNGDYTERETGFFASEPRKIDVELEGRDITVDHYSVSSGNSTTYYTRVRASCEAPSDLKLRVFKTDGFSGLARAVGFQDVPVGDPEFDENYIIKASDPELAPWWINQHVRDAIVGADVGYRYKLERGVVTTERAGLEDDPDGIVAAVQATAAFANGKRRLLNAWNLLARDFDGEATSVPAGWVRVDGQHEGVPFSIEIEDVRDYHFTVIEARITTSTGKAEPFALSKEGHLFGSTMPRVEPPPFDTGGYKLYGLDVSKVAGLVDDADLSMLKKLDAAKLRVDEDRVTIMLYGVVTKKRPLHAAIALAARLASGARHGPYR